MKSKSLEWRLARLRYIRSVKDQLPIEFRKDIERAEQAIVADRIPAANAAHARHFCAIKGTRHALAQL